VLRLSWLLTALVAIAFAAPSVRADPPKKDDPGKPVRLDVPYVPTPENVVEEMLKIAGVKEGDVVYDLGCGDGRIVVTAVKKFKAKKGLGIDIDPQRTPRSRTRRSSARGTSSSSRTCPRPASLPCTCCRKSTRS
jgi:hypothetical protein